jgi:hypothetical protein
LIHDINYVFCLIKKIIDKLEEQLNLLENYVPFWISIIYSDGKEYVKLDTSQKYNRVKSTLKQCIATM